MARSRSSLEGAANFGAWVPAISVVESPYVWRDADHLVKAMAGPVGRDFNNELVAKRGMRILGTTYYGTRHLTTSNKAVKTPADLVGFKLRVPENDVFKAMAEAWGAKPTPMNFGELYLALKQGTVDGQENPLPTIKSGKFDEVQKYLVLTGHIITPRLVVVNEAFWKGLKPADQKIIQDAVDAGIAWQNAELIKQEKELIETFKAAGVTVVPVDIDAFKQPVVKRRGPEVREQVGQGHVRKAEQHEVSAAGGCDASPSAHVHPDPDPLPHPRERERRPGRIGARSTRVPAERVGVTDVSASGNGPIVPDERTASHGRTRDRRGRDRGLRRHLPVRAWRR